MKRIQLFLFIIIFYLNSVRGQAVDCKKQQNGFTFESDKGCHAFNICVFSRQIEKECPYGLHYDSYSTNCKNPNDIVNGKCSVKEMCLNRDGEKYPHADCDKFYLCYQNKPLLKNCNNPLHFDYKKKICTLPEHIDGPCNEKNTTNICAKEKDGKSLPHSDKTKFYFCIDGKSVVMDCGKGLIFDKEREFCVAPGTPKNFQFPCNRKLYE